MQSKSTLSKLPDEILLKIFNTFPLSDRLRLEIVCKQWQRILESKESWKDILELFVTKNGVESGPSHQSLNFSSTRGAFEVQLIPVLDRCGIGLRSLTFEGPIDNFILNSRLIRIIEKSLRGSKLVKLLFHGVAFYPGENEQFVEPIGQLLNVSQNLAEFSLITCKNAQCGVRVKDSVLKVDLVGQPLFRVFSSSEILLHLPGKTLTSLDLEDILISPKHLRTIADNIGGNLKKLCFKMFDWEKLALDEFLRIVPQLSGIQELNLGDLRGRDCLATVFDDNFLRIYISELKNLVKLSIATLPQQNYVSANGVEKLLLASKQLQFLDINGSRYVSGRDLLDALNLREMFFKNLGENMPNLTIFAAGTLIPKDWLVGKLPKGVTVLDDSKSQRTAFLNKEWSLWGVSDLNCINPESFDADSDNDLADLTDSADEFPGLTDDSDNEPPI